jgi:hypothetical protein
MPHETQEGIPTVLTLRVGMVAEALLKNLMNNFS